MGRLTEVIVIRLEKRYMDKLRRIARQKGIGVSTLARMWIMEKLQSTHN